MKTRLTELLGIKHPIIQGAMGWVSLPPLVAAVSNAGGLGILGSGGMTPEEMQEAIREVKSLTDKPFGANLIPINPQREEELLDVLIEEKVSVVSFGKGDPTRIIERSKQEGPITLPTLGSVRHAAKAETVGADAVIVQGTEAGGHCSRISTMVLVPLAVDRVAIPVVAAGGFADSRGLLAALSLGAEGISMGTRFMVTKECPIPDNVKQRILRTSEMQTVVTDNHSGVRCRILRNKLAEEFLDMGYRRVPPEEMEAFGKDKVRKAFVEGDVEHGTVAMGQVAGLIDDIPTCRELIEGIVYGTEAILEQVRQRVMA